jgi:ParB-like chromosome segregation protein Spo0J
MAKIDRVQEVSLELLKPYENNAKIHGETQVKQIADSISEFGFLSPCLIDHDYNIIAGHGRVMAAKKLGMETVPCVFIEGLTEAQRRAYILADNKLTEMGEWDDIILNNELAELKDMDFDISLTGFEFIDADNYGTDFTLPDGDQGSLEQMSFVLAHEQAELIKYAISIVDDDIQETFGNTNKNGNALYEVIRQWAEQKR